jgi:hypothetical protein
MGAVWTSRECFGINLSGERIGVPGFRQPGAGSVRSLLPLACLAGGNEQTQSAAEDIQKWLTEQWPIFNDGAPCPLFTIDVDATAPQQINGVDCGIFMLANIMAQIQGNPHCGEIDPPRARACWKSSISRG